MSLQLTHGLIDAWRGTHPSDNIHFSLLCISAKPELITFFFFFYHVT